MESDTLIYQYKDKLYGLCMHLEKNTYYAEELFQDTWVKALSQMESYNPSYAFYPWLSKIAVNLYRDRLRKLKLEIRFNLWSGNDDELERQDAKVDVEKHLLEREDIRLMKECIQKLDSKYRVPLILSVAEGLSYGEIASILELKESTVKSRIYDGRQKLKKLLEKEGLYGGKTV